MRTYQVPHDNEFTHPLGKPARTSFLKRYWRGAAQSAVLAGSVAFLCVAALGSTDYGSQERQAAVDPWLAASSPTQAYLSARDKAIAVAESPEINDERDQRAPDGLQTMVRALVGPICVKGFPAQGTNHLTTLTSEIGFGMLDGLTASSLDGKTQLVVTTKPLLLAWLAEHQHWQNSATDNLPADISSAFKNENFYIHNLLDKRRLWSTASRTNDPSPQVMYDRPSGRCKG
jgi:hypothetical protein